jgi:cell division protein FtsN
MEKPREWRYLVQAGAFTRPEGARTRLAQLQKLNLSPHLEEAVVRGIDFTRVVVGPFENREQVAKVQTTLKTAKLEFFLRRVR